MVFKTDRQRKAVMAKLNQGGTRVSFQPSIINIKKQIKVPEVLSISDVRKINREAGQFFFEPSSMKFFDSKIETQGLLINNRLFVTSEQFTPSVGKADPRKFTVRGLNKKTGSIDTVSEFQQFKTKESAVAFAIKQR